MGVPGFFMWLWKNYKGDHFVFNKNELEKEFDSKLIKKVNNIDYLLIDTNCLLHPMCFKILAEKQDSLRNKKNVDFDKLEKAMMDQCFKYLDEIIEYVNPNKGVYIAIDGVAPVAKIKQQRSRRFKSVNDRKLRDNLKKKHGKELDFFWNNSAITPGTKFMDVLDKRIKKWLESKDKKDNFQYIYSSCRTPAEGEHKLLQFIRDNKNNDSYVIYGLDADLIFLALSTNKDNIFLLREAVHLKNGNHHDLNYVYMKTVKECVETTISNMIKNQLNDTPLEVKIKTNSLISDFVFICYFLGNDFLPHFESCNITEGGLKYLLKSYCKLFIEKSLKNKSPYIINLRKKDRINLENLVRFIEIIAENEEGILERHYGKKKRRYGSKSDDAYEKELFKIEHLMFKIKDPIQLGNGEFEEYRKRYYKHYYNTNDNDVDKFVNKMCSHYMRGLKWVTDYYFDKCPSWNWYYPYEHPPFLKDLYNYTKKFKLSNIKFELGEPIKPLMQLFCVLPPQSDYLIPKSIRFLINNNKSPLSHLYPFEFQQDYINKGMYWKAIPYLPPLEINLVKKSFEKYKNKLDKNEEIRNTFTEIFEY